MSKLGSIIKDAALPGTARQAPPPPSLPTSFETALRDHFAALRAGQPYDWLAIDLLPHPSPEGFDYAYWGLSRGMDVRFCLRQMNNPALLLDLHKPFNDQWPADFTGMINHPRQLKEVPFWNRVAPFDPPKITYLSEFRR